jgi:hypothetical protein
MNLIIVQDRLFNKCVETKSPAVNNKLDYSKISIEGRCLSFQIFIVLNFLM